MRAQVFREEAICHWCGDYVDQRLDRTHPMSRTVDHIDPLAKGGDALKRENLRLMHRRCNSIRANAERKRRWTPPTLTSTDVNAI